MNPRRTSSTFDAQIGRRLQIWIGFMLGVLMLLSTAQVSQADTLFTKKFFKTTLLKHKITCGKGCSFKIKNPAHILSLRKSSSAHGSRDYRGTFTLMLRTKSPNCYSKQRVKLSYKKKGLTWFLEKAVRNSNPKETCLPKVETILAKAKQKRGWSQAQELRKLQYHEDTIKHLPKLKPFLMKQTGRYPAMVVTKVILKLDRTKGVDFFLSLLKDMNVRRPRVNWALGHYTEFSGKIMPWLLGNLFFKGETNKITAAKAAGKFGANAFMVVPQLERMWKSEKSLKVRAAILEGLSNILQGEARMDFLQKGYNSKEGLLQKAAVKSLFQWKRKDLYSLAMKWFQWEKKPQALTLLISNLLQATVETRSNSLKVSPKLAKQLLLKLSEKSSLPRGVRLNVNYKYYRKAVIQGIMSSPTDNTLPGSIILFEFNQLLKKNRYNSYSIVAKLQEFERKYALSNKQLLNYLMFALSHQDKDIAGIAWKSIERLGPLAASLRNKLVAGKGALQLFPIAKVLPILGSMGASGHSTQLFRHYLLSGKDSAQRAALQGIQNLGAHAFGLRDDLYKLYLSSKPKQTQLRVKILKAYTNMGPWGKPYLQKILKTWKPSKLNSNELKPTPERVAMLHGLLELGTSAEELLPYIEISLSPIITKWQPFYIMHLLGKQKPLTLKVVPVMMQAFKHKRTNLYRKTFQAAKQLPKLPPAMKKWLIQQLTTNKLSKRVRSGAIDLLGKKADLTKQERVALATPILKNPKDPDFTDGARLLKGAGAAAKALVPTLVKSLKSSQWKEKYGAQIALTEIGKPAIKPLQPLLSHSNRWIAIRTADLLLGMKQHGNEVLPLFFDEMKRKKIHYYVQSATHKACKKWPKVAVPFLEALMKTGTKLQKQRLRRSYILLSSKKSHASWLAQQLKMLDGKMQNEALYELCNKPYPLKQDKPSLQKLFEQVAQSKQSWFAYTGIRCIKKFRMVSSRKIVKTLLSSKQSSVRRGAYSALFSFPLSNKEKKKLLFQWLNDKSSSTASGGVRQALSMKTKPTYLSKTIFAMLYRKNMSFYRESLRHSIFRLGIDSSLTNKILIKGITDGNIDQSLAAAALLLKYRKVNHAEALRVFRREVNRSNFMNRLRREAAKHLVAIHHPQAIVMLMKMLADQDRKLSILVAKGVLKHQKLPTTYISWLVQVLESKNRFNGSPSTLLKILGKYPPKVKQATRALGVGLMLKEETSVLTALKLLQKRGKHAVGLLPHIRVLKDHQNPKIRKSAQQCAAILSKLVPSSQPSRPKAPAKRPSSTPSR